jgi:hypothetical protein
MTQTYPTHIASINRGNFIKQHLLDVIKDKSDNVDSATRVAMPVANINHLAAIDGDTPTATCSTTS